MAVITLNPQDEKNLRKKIKQLVDFMPKDARDSLADFVRETVPVAKTLAPRVTGELRDSIHGSSGPTWAEIRADAPYAAIVEFGKRGDGTPFFRPAIDGGVSELLQDLTRKFKNIKKK